MVFYLWTTIHFLPYLAHFFLEWEMFQKKRCRENQNTHFVFSIFFKSYRLWDKVEKCCIAWQTTDDNMAHAHCMLDTLGCQYTLRLCNTHCFPTATMVVRTRLNVTLCVHYLSYSYLSCVVSSHHKITEMYCMVCHEV